LGIDSGSGKLQSPRQAFLPTEQSAIAFSIVVEVQALSFSAIG
jgi:hypothetical protein